LLVVPLLAFPLAGQDYSNIEVERVVHGYVFTEGPAWSRDGFLLFADVPSNRILKWTPGEAPETFREDSSGAIGNAFDGQGRLYTCESHARRVTRTDKKGRVEVLAERWEGKRLNAPNDLVVSANGHVYFTDPAFGNQQDTRELDFYGVFHITPKGGLSVIAKPAGRPNGIALSPKGRILYVTNSDEHNIRAYDVERGGEVSGERMLVTGIDGVPDGLRVDDKGNLYVAAKGIAIYTAEGRIRTTLPMGEKPSNLAFGDGDQHTLYITARTSIYRVRLP
jgi:gluconolactonase